MTVDEARRDEEEDEEVLSWQGLEVPIREEWRPLRIEGTHDGGSITVGDMNGPVFQLRWIRPPKGYDGEKWIEKRRARVAGGQESPAPPRPGAFARVGWIKRLAIREESEKTVWWGCSRDGEVLVEVLLTNLCAPEANAWFLDRALPRLKVLPFTRESTWRIYGSRFLVPPGYILGRKRLATGDMALEFVRGKRQRLLVRQVFPAGLALERRALAGWLKDRPFGERRRFRREAEESADKRKLKWTGWKRLPFPLGGILPRRCESVILHDEELDRLLIAESEWRDGSAAVSVDEIARGMKRSPE